MALEGQQLGRYRLLHLIGSGGMGEVYLAEDPHISRQIAIKVLRTEAIGFAETESSKGAARLFQREARAIAMLDHPRILPLYDYGEQQLQGARYTYMVMPYRQEGSLADWLQQRGETQALSAQDVEQIVQQAAVALQYAHDHQIVHQDVKPSNFLLRTNKDAPNRPDLLLADFGIAKLSSLTSGASQNIRGTPSYMAPEQWEGHAVPATDQYALAVMVYELLTGRPPFRGNPMQMMFAHVNTQPQAPSLLNPHLSGQLDAVLLRALSKKPEERFPSVQAFDLAFREALRSIDPSTSMQTWGPDRSTLVKTPSTPAAHQLFATLAISEEEARTGSNRTITLPGGRQVSVFIPAGAQDGQVITLGEQGEPLRAGDSGSRLQLKLSVVRASGEYMPPTLSARENIGWYEDPTVLTNRQSIPANTGTTIPNQNVSTQPDPRIASFPGGYPLPGVPPSVPPAAIASNQSGFNYAGSPPYRGEPVSTKPPPKRPTGSIILIVLLVCLLIGGSVGLFYYFGGRSSGSPGAATSTTTIGTNNDATATAQAIATATAIAQGIAQQNATATAIDQQNATATGVAQGIAQQNATATAIAQQNATATSIAQQNATATATAQVTAQYAGTWVNDDPNTRDIPEVIISSVGQTLYVHPFGACTPTYCDWGTVSGMFHGEPFMLTFVFDGSRPDACCKGAPTNYLSISFANTAKTELKVVSTDSAAGTIVNLMHKG